MGVANGYSAKRTQMACPDRAGGRYENSARAEPGTRWR